MWNFNVVVNVLDVLIIFLNEEGWYVCEVKNQFGKDKKEFIVKFVGKNVIFVIQLIEQNDYVV